MENEPLHGPRLVKLAFMALVSAHILVGLVLLARRYRVATFLLAWLGLLAAVHARAAFNGTNHYAGFKILSHTYFIVILAAAAPLFGSVCIRRRAARIVLALWLTVAGLCCYRVMHFIHTDGFNVAFTQLRESLTVCGELELLQSCQKA